ncbi:MAG: hypothetical protein IJC86_05360 [Clostridia bacterium]|nr:hypothetical protein [Clostridia bacterium]
MSVKLLRHHMIESIKLLASDGEVQLSCYPDFVCKGDEIANSLGDWLLLYQEKRELEDKLEDRYAFLPEELMQIIDLDEDISMLAPEEFSDYAILNSHEWKKIRDKAKKILILLKEEYSLPDKRSI